MANEKDPAKGAPTYPRHDPSPAVLAAASNVEATTDPPLAGATIAPGPENAAEPATDAPTAGLTFATEIHAPETAAEAAVRPSADKPHEQNFEARETKRLSLIHI